MAVGGGGGDRLLTLRGHAEAADHRRQRQPPAFQAGHLQGSGAAGAGVYGPRDALRQVSGQGGRAGIEHVGRNPALGVAAGAVGTNRLQVDRQGVARRGAGYPERPGLRIAGGGDLVSRRVAAVGIYGRGGDSISRFDGKYRVMRTERGVIRGGNELMIGHRRAPPSRPAHVARLPTQDTAVARH